jgi:hypothetical protein
VATRKRLQSRDVASDSRAKDSADDHGGLLRCRSRDRVVHLADRRRIAMHQAAWVVDAASGGKGRRSEKRLGGLHRHASARHAISEAFSEAKTFRNSASGSMTRNNPASTQCNASLERCGEISTPSQTR